MKSTKERPDVVVPRQPSNRSVYEQMLRWGWTPGKTDGNWVSMHAPNVGKLKGTRIRIRPATQHAANPTSTFKEIYAAICDGDARLFWAGPSPMYDQLLAAAAEADRQQEAERQRRSAERFTERAQRIAKEEEDRRRRETVRVETVIPPPEMPAPITKGKPVNNPSDVPPSREVLATMAGADQPVTVHWLCEKMRISPTDENRRHMAARCNYLIKMGMAERVMGGTYRIAGSAKRIDARIQHDHSAATPQADQSSTPAAGHPAPEQSAAPAAAPLTLPVSAPPPEIDDTIEAVLDLLLPDGFKASHLRYIAPWVEATKKMVMEVTNGR